MIYLLIKFNRVYSITQLLNFLLNYGKLLLEKKIVKTEFAFFYIDHAISMCVYIQNT